MHCFFVDHEKIDPFSLSPHLWQSIPGPGWMDSGMKQFLSKPYQTSSVEDDIVFLLTTRKLTNCLRFLIFQFMKWKLFWSKVPVCKFFQTKDYIVNQEKIDPLSLWKPFQTSSVKDDIIFLLTTRKLTNYLLVLLFQFM